MSENNSTKKLGVEFITKPDGSRWVKVLLLKYGPPFPIFIPSFRDLHRIVQALAVCEDEKYPPPAKGRIRLLEFLRDAVLKSDFEALAQRYKIPERDGDTVVNSNGAALPKQPAVTVGARLYRAGLGRRDPLGSPMTAAILDVTNPASANSVGTELALSTQDLTQRLRLAPITDLPSIEQAVDDRRTLGDAAKRVEEFFAPLKQLAHKLHKALCDRENAITGPLLLLDAAKKRQISAFKQAQDDLRAQRERELAEQRRRDDQTRAAAEAAALETSGEPELAAAVIAEAIAAPLPVVSIVDETKSVVKFRRVWKWRYTTDEARALQLLPREFLAVDTVKLNKYAAAMRESAKVPGISFYYDDTPIR